MQVLLRNKKNSFKVKTIDRTKICSFTYVSLSLCLLIICRSFTPPLQFGTISLVSESFPIFFQLFQFLDYSRLAPTSLTKK